MSDFPPGPADLRDRLGRPPEVPEPEAVGGTATPPCAAGPPAGGDLRTLEVDYDAQGERFKAFRVACRESTQEAFLDQPVEGPPSALTICKNMERADGDPRAWLRSFLRNKGIGENGGVARELRVLCEILYWAAVYDQLNLGGLMCIGVAARRAAGLVAVYSDPAKPARGRARLYAGRPAEDDIAGQALQQFATRKIKEQEDAQRVLSFGKGPRAQEGEGGQDDGKGPGRRPSKGPKGGEGGAAGSPKGQ